MLFLWGYFFGISSGVPFGGSQIEMAKRAVSGQLFAAMMVVLGSVSSDVIYGAVALFQMAPFMENRWVLLGLYLGGAAMLWVLAYLTFKEIHKSPKLDLSSKKLTSKWKSYLLGFSLAFSNPALILAWLFAFALGKNFGLVPVDNTESKVTFILAGGLGNFTYLGGLALILYRMKHFFSEKYYQRLYKVLGYLLILISFYFIFKIFKFFRFA